MDQYLDQCPHGLDEFIDSRLWAQDQ